MFRQRPGKEKRLWANRDDEIRGGNTEVVRGFLESGGGAGFRVARGGSGSGNGGVTGILSDCIAARKEIQAAVVAAKADGACRMDGLMAPVAALASLTIEHQDAANAGVQHIYTEGSVFAAVPVKQFAERRALELRGCEDGQPQAVLQKAADGGVHSVRHGHTQSSRATAGARR